VVSPAESYLSLGGKPVPSIDIHGACKYLGINTGAGLKIGDAATHRLEEHLKQLSKALLKPQQRLFFLQVHVLPGLYHELVLCKFSKGLLHDLDQMARAAASRWVHMPHDVPKALFHAPTDKGGLGLPELLVQIPLLRRARIEKLFNRAKPDLDPVLAATVENSDLRRERERFEQGISCYQQTVTSRATRERTTETALHTSCDGCGLKDCSEVPVVSRWVSSETGKSFVDALHVRAGCLYTKVRASRGRNKEGACSLTCEVCHVANFRPIFRYV